jgi:23S rRNA (cytidine1920-2'-O)/16S rRNA (cytidine1409-2'-O)-methyltransferase
MKKVRLDLLLVSRGLAPTRSRAQALILAGRVAVDGERRDKAGEAILDSASVSVAEPEHPYVSRGGIKLAAALDHFGIDPKGRMCLDVGASTGGFTDCLLQRGAARVYAIDVGRGQLDARLRDDPRVILQEKVNARFVTRRHVPELCGLAVADVSFISLRLVLPAVGPLLDSDADAVVLIKPQFEAGRGEVPRGGVVRSQQTRDRVVSEIETFGLSLGWVHRGTIPSPILGDRGNQEYLAAFRTPGSSRLS